MPKKLSVSEAVAIAKGCTDFYKSFARLEEMLATVVDIDKERAKAEEARDVALVDQEEAEQRLSAIEAKIESKRVELDKAIEGASTRVEAEKQRVQEPLKKVKEDLRQARYVAEQEKQKITREINDRQATKAQLDAQIRQAEENLRDRVRERGVWEQERARFSEEQEAHQREVRSLQQQKATLLDQIERLDARRIEKLKEEVKTERRAGA